MAIAINRPFIRLVNNEKRDKSSEKYPPKLPVINNMTIGRDAIPKEKDCLLYTSPSPRDRQKSRMPSSA